MVAANALLGGARAAVSEPKKTPLPTPPPVLNRRRRLRRFLDTPPRAPWIHRAGSSPRVGCASPRASPA